MIPLSGSSFGLAHFSASARGGKIKTDMVGHLTLVTRSATPSTKEYAE
jgi:hypothetical protein